MAQEQALFPESCPKVLATPYFFHYNRECCMNAMKRKVADTPGPDAMAGREIFAEKFIFKMSEKEG